jgi:hypothetical protein
MTLPLVKKGFFKLLNGIMSKKTMSFTDFPNSRYGSAPVREKMDFTLKPSHGVSLLLCDLCLKSFILGNFSRIQLSQGPK